MSKKTEPCLGVYGGVSSHYSYAHCPGCTETWNSLDYYRQMLTIQQQRVEVQQALKNERSKFDIATERIAELEQEVITLNGDALSIFDLKMLKLERDLISTRTLAGELATTLRNASHMIDKKGILRTQILKEAKATLAKAEKMEVG